MSLSGEFQLLLPLTRKGFNRTVFDALHNRRASNRFHITFRTFHFCTFCHQQAAARPYGSRAVSSCAGRSEVGFAARAQKA